MSVISGTLAAINARKNAKDQTKQDQATNALNKQMFDESRGKTGNVLLPTYLGEGGFEQRYGSDLVKAYDESGTVPYADYAGAAAGWKPALSGAQRDYTGIWNGSLQNKLAANAAPVQAGRVAFTRQASIDALNKTLGEIAAQQAAKGYNGDSYSTRRLRLDANLSRSSAVAAANLANLQDTRSMRDAVTGMQISQNPNSRLNESIDAVNAPIRGYVGAVQQRSGILAPVRLDQRQFTYQPVSAGGGPSVGGAAFAGLGQLGASIGRSVQGQQSLNAWQRQPSYYAGSNSYAPSSPYANPDIGGGYSGPAAGAGYGAGYGGAEMGDSLGGGDFWSGGY